MMLIVITEIIYHFLDASVPPPYHRSFTITATEAEVRVVVDSYGEILADETLPLEPGVFQGLVDALTMSDIRIGEEISSEGYTGGTTETLTVYAGDEVIFSGYVYNCAGKKFGTLRGDDLGSFADSIRALIPNLSELRRT